MNFLWYLLLFIHAKMKREIQKYLNSQAVDDGSSLSLLSFTLPLVHLQDQFEEGAFGGGDFSMPRPSQVLELTNHQVALLRLRESEQHTHLDQILKHRNTSTQRECTDPGEVADSEESADNITVHRAGHTFHLDRTVTQHALLWPVLGTTLSTTDTVFTYSTCAEKHTLREAERDTAVRKPKF